MSPQRSAASGGAWALSGSKVERAGAVVERWACSPGLPDHAARVGEARVSWAKAGPRNEPEVVVLLQAGLRLHKGRTAAGSLEAGVALAGLPEAA